MAGGRNSVGKKQGEGGEVGEGEVNERRSCGVSPSTEAGD